MALNFAGAATNTVDVADASALTNLDGYTFMCWQYLTARGGTDCLFNKDNKLKFRDGDANTNLQLIRLRATTNTSYITNDTPVDLNAWNFLAFTFDTGGGAGEIVNIYKGTLATAATESTYGTSDDGSGALISDAGGGLRIGNDESNDAWQGRIAGVHLVDSVLSLSEIRIQQNKWQQRADSIFLIRLGKYGVGLQYDETRHGHNGTVTGARPASDPFGERRRRVFKAPAAVGGLSIPVAMHHYTKNVGAL